MSEPPAREERPASDSYYEVRLGLFSQGDIFEDVPLAYPMPATEMVEEERFGGGSRRFLSGPLDYGKAMLITPTCNMRNQGQAKDVDYAHPVRTLVPVMPLEEKLQRTLDLNASRLGMLRKYDELISYMYLPEAADLGIAESLALLYMPITLHHDMIVDQRITQLALEGARQLHRKLVWFMTGIRPPRESFSPPLD